MIDFSIGNGVLGVFGMARRGTVSGSKRRAADALSRRRARRGSARIRAAPRGRHPEPPNANFSKS